jgi:hypothetical protein
MVKINLEGGRSGVCESVISHSKRETKEDLEDLSKS